MTDPDKLYRQMCRQSKKKQLRQKTTKLLLVETADRGGSGGGALSLKRKIDAEEAEQEEQSIKRRARPMPLIMYELQAQQDERLVYRDIVSRAHHQFLENHRADEYLAQRTLCELWGWQREVIQFIDRREHDSAEIGSRGLMFCLDMGLGKTVMSLEYMLLDNQRCYRQTSRRYNGCTLIVCQNALVLENWLEEVRQKYPRAAFHSQRLYSAKNRLVHSLYIEHCCDFVVVTYATVKAAYKCRLREESLQNKSPVSSDSPDDDDDDDDEDDDEDDDDYEEEMMPTTTTKMGLTEKAYKHEILYGIRWKRIIADEFHICVNRQTLLYKAMMQLQSDVKWVVTGTPIQNSLSDICSSFNFIGLPLGSQLEQYLTKDVTPAEQKLLMQHIKETLQVVMIRRLKSEIPREHTLFFTVHKSVRLIEFETFQEKLVYYLYATYGSRQWQSILSKKEKHRLEKGSTKMKTTSVASILQLLMQLCIDARIVKDLILPYGLLPLQVRKADEPLLLLKKKDFTDTALDRVDSKSSSSKEETYDNTLEYFASRLNKETHFSYQRGGGSLSFNLTSDYSIQYYGNVISEAIELNEELQGELLQRNDESVMWNPFAKSEFFDLKESEDDRARYQNIYQRLNEGTYEVQQLLDLSQECGDDQAYAMISHLASRLLDASQCCTKNRHIIRYIRETPGDDKVIVFSNSVCGLESLAYDLTQAGITSIMVTGSSHRDNTERMILFKERSAATIKVLLLSFKMGNGGLNLACANHILFVHPWWNPNMMDQAENRAQRIGQMKPVYIVYFILNRTIDLYVLTRSHDKKSMTTSLMDAQKENEGSSTTIAAAAAAAATPTEEDDERHYIERYAYNLAEYTVSQPKKKSHK